MKLHIAAAGALLAMALTSSAQSSGSITISGTVANRTSIAVAQQGLHNNLPIEAGCTDEKVADVTETSNNRAGYTVTLRSANAGTGNQAFLKGATSENTDTANYTMEYGGTTVSLVGGVATVTSSTTRTPKEGTVKGLTVTMDAAWITEDTYRDTLTLTIKAN